MEPAKIDWKRIDSRFVVDSVYEHINAPNWVDFLSPEPQDAIGDQAWFCRPDCNHPKTAEDFLNTTPTSNSKRSAGVSQISPLKDWNQGNANVKRRGLRHSPNNISHIHPKFSEDSENQNPSLSTPPNQQANFFKAAAAGAIKSSSEKKKQLLVDDNKSESEEVGGLKSTLSARNLFGSRDIFNHITEFCNELKKLATRVRERENEEKTAVVVKEPPPPPPRKILGEITEMEVSEKKLLVDGNAKDKPRRKKRGDEAENIPISVNLEKVVKHKGEERLLQSRTNPPSPQCFSAPSSKASTRSKLMMERGVLEEVKQNKDEGVATVSSSSSSSSSIIDGRQARALDVFWFLKPCTLSD
ncbi:hypothetical protein SLEP1_g36669 [Rubroshorea leprosula]|uniref:Uncharacterized protein n=1 Tax=Rubroshorea leprosula TaxID=152421 RepID=A0AAV5KSN2_9ROSI|nr:hypothetical protein SLEP1_g36669 [Rubroshorea leprosula]